MSITSKEFGITKDGKKVTIYTLKNSNGIEASFIDLGAQWVTMMVPDKDGNFDDVILGYDTVEKYENNKPHFGAPIGRYANRIAGGKFSLNGKKYQLAVNSDTNSLHSGPDLWHNRMWQSEIEESELGSKIIFSLISPDGDQGFEGEAKVSVAYILTEEDAIMIEYNMSCDKDTLCNLTNHCYFNLAGHKNKDILNQEVWIDADVFTPSDSHSIPTGEMRSVKGTPMDFTSMRRIGNDIDSDYECIVQGRGYDHNWVVNKRSENMQLIAKSRDSATGRLMKVYSDLPGVHFYTGNSIQSLSLGKDGAEYPKRSGYCFETQFYPNAINMKDVPQPIVKAGETFHSFTTYKFVVDTDEKLL